MRRWLVRENNGNPWCLKINKFGGRDTVTTHNEQVFGIFFRYGKNYLMSSLAMFVRPSAVELTLERGTDR